MSIKESLIRPHFSLRELMTHRSLRIFAVSGQTIAAPESWSEIAVQMLADKYLRKGEVVEASADQLFERVLKALCLQSPLSEEETEILRSELLQIFRGQIGMFNSPVWFNCGLFEAYGILGEGEFFAFSESKAGIEKIRGAYLRPQVSACFIQKIEDSMSGIFDLLKTEALIFKYGSGSGTNFSPLRSKHEALSGGGTSSGLLSFLNVFDAAAGATKSGGVTRRSAKMVCLDVDHPEIMEFVNWKKDEEIKLGHLVQLGYSGGLEGEAVRSVSGQNANHSVRVSDEFLHAVDAGEDWSLTARVGGREIVKISAPELWQSICTSAWSCADPGIQFSSTINKWHMCKNSGPINASNPCSEYMFLDDSACNLASLNLLKFSKGNEFDFESLDAAARAFILAQDTWVDYAGYPTRKIAENSHRFRPLGLGFTNLGSLLLSMAIAYDSEVGRRLASRIMARIHSQAVLTSAEIAERLGAFDGYAENSDCVEQVLEMHLKACEDIDDKIALATYQKALSKVKKNGLRNAQLTVVAPTGTISIVMDCETTGIEPEYALTRKKQLIGGGVLEFANTSVVTAFELLGYSVEQISKFKKQIDKGEFPSVLAKHKVIFQTAIGENAISPAAHVKMVAAVQPFVSGAISKTVNLNRAATVSDVSEIYMMAHQLGLKSVSIYRDGSKELQPLNSDFSCDC